MTVYNRLTDDQTAFKFGVGQDVARQARDNQDSFDERIIQLNGGLLLFDHFNWNPDETNRGVERLTNNPDLTALTVEPAIGRDWAVFDSATNPALRTSRLAFSVLRLTATPSGAWISMYSKFNLQFDQITKPMKMLTRVKSTPTTTDEIFCGMREGISNVNVFTTNAAGVWLERVDATDYRFVSHDGSTKNNGPSFAQPSHGTWFEIELEFTDTPSDRVIGRLDGVDKTAGGLTVNLPTDRALHATFNVYSSSTGPHHLDIDRVRMSAEGLSDAP